VPFRAASTFHFLNAADCSKDFLHRSVQGNLEKLPVLCDAVTIERAMRQSLAGTTVCDHTGVLFSRPGIDGLLKI